MFDNRDYLRRKNIKFNEIRFNIEPKTSKDVAKSYGCTLKQVLKTLVFIGSDIVIVVMQGNKKVNMKKLELVCDDKKIRMATPKEIKDLFGKEIGSLDPFMEITQCKKIMDNAIFRMDKVNMGSGVPDIGIEMTTDELKKAWDGLIVQDISL